MSNWLNDIRWSANVRRARKFRRNLSFSKRKIFDEELRYRTENSVVSYPDAFYHLTIDDLLRAMLKAKL